MGTMMRIGLTGGIAAGKSTVAAQLKQLGALHIDYDALAHQIVEPGGVALPQIVAEFGPDALLADGTMNRPWIADHVFGANAAPGARERLDAIEHPLIYAEAARLEHEHPEQPSSFTTFHCSPRSLTIFHSPLTISSRSKLPCACGSTVWSRNAA